MDYRLKPIGKLCAVTGAELRPGQRCRSALVETDGQFHRVDVLEAAWNGPPSGAIGHWRSVVPDSQRQRPKPLDGDALLRCFEQMSEDAHPGHEKFRYILALLLLQKKKIQITGSREEDDATIMELTGVRGEGPWEVRDQKLAETELDELQAALVQRLSEDSADDADQP